MGVHRASFVTTLIAVLTSSSAHAQVPPDTGLTDRQAQARANVAESLGPAARLRRWRER